MFLFKITKEEYATVDADTKEEAYEKVEDGEYFSNDEEVVDIELVDVYNEDVDTLYDEHKLMESDFNYEG